MKHDFLHNISLVVAVISTIFIVLMLYWHHKAKSDPKDDFRMNKVLFWIFMALDILSTTYLLS